MATQKVEITPKTVVFTVFFLISLYLLFLIRDVIIGLFISVLLTSALHPWVTKLEKYKIPRPLGILLIYVLSFSFIVMALATIVPPLIDQTNNLLKTLPVETISKALPPLEVNFQNLEIITNQLGSVRHLINFITSTFSGIITIFTFMVITYYLLMERKQLPKYLLILLHDHSDEKRAEEFVNQIDHQIGGWVRGEMLLMLIVGIITYIGLLLLNIPYSLSLAIIAGLFELIPNIGPTLSAIPAVVIALLTASNPIMVVFVAALYILVQQLENHIIVPRVMKSTLGLHPLATIFSLIIGLKLAGVMGGILAVPVLLVIKIIYVFVIGPRFKIPKIF